MTLLQPVDEGIWVLDAPQKFLGLHLGTRMTVVRLASGGLWVHSPVALTDALRGEVSDLGPVEHIVGPNLYHHLRLGEWVAAFGDAKLHGAPGLAKKRPDLSFHSALADGVAPWGEELRPISIRGTLLRETVFVHDKTRSLVVTDLIENFDTSDHWPTRMYLKLGGIHGKIGVSRPLRLAYRKRDEVREDLDRVLAQAFDRIVICHGAIIEGDAREKLREGYAWL